MRRSRSRRTSPVRLGLLVLGMWFHSRAQAQEADAQSLAPAVDRVQVTLIGTVAGALDLRDLLSEWLSREHVDLEIREAPTLPIDQVLNRASDPGLLRVWVVPLAGGPARVYFADAGAERFLVRDVPLESGLDELGRERLAQVLSSSARAFIERRVSSTRQEALSALGANGGADAPAVTGLPRPADPPQSSPPNPTENERHPIAKPRLQTELRLGGEYTTTLRGPEGTGHGPGMFVGGSLALATMRWSLSGHLQYEWPEEVSGSHVAVRVERVGVRGLLGVEPASAGWGWVASAGAGVDWALYRPRATDNVTTARPSGFAERPVLWCGAGGRYGYRELRAAVLLTVGVPLVKVHYDVVVDGQTRVEIEPWPVYPGAAAVVTWH